MFLKEKNKDIKVVLADPQVTNSNPPPTLQNQAAIFFREVFFIITSLLASWSVLQVNLSLKALDRGG